MNGRIVVIEHGKGSCLAGEADVELVVEEEEAEDDVLVEGVLDEAREAVGRQAPVHQQQPHLQFQIPGLYRNGRRNNGVEDEDASKTVFWRPAYDHLEA